MKKEDFKTNCPFCKMGFYLMCKSPTEVEHMDIMWSREAGQIFGCADPEAIIPHIIPNKEYGTGYSLSKDMQEIFTELAEDFYKDPSEFNKDNVDENTFMGLIGTYYRYADYMDDKELREDIDPNEVTRERYKEGKNIKEIMEEITHGEQKEDSEILEERS